MPRVPAITGKSNVPAQHHDVVDHVLKVFGNVRGPFSMLLHSPKLADKLLSLGDFYRDDSIVASKDRSLAILVGVRERKAAYVWAAQVNAARGGVADRITWAEGPGLEPLSRAELEGRVDAVASNPPYIPTEEIGNLPREVREGAWAEGPPLLQSRCVEAGTVSTGRVPGGDRVGDA